MFLQSCRYRINKNKEYSNFLHTYCYANHARDIFDRRSVKSTVHLFNGTLIYWHSKKHYEISRRTYNAEIRAISTGALDQNWINFFRLFGYPIVPPSKIYEDKKIQLKYSWRTESIPDPDFLTSWSLLSMKFIYKKHLKWWKQYLTWKFWTSNTSLMAEKSSGIS